MSGAFGWGGNDWQPAAPAPRRNSNDDDDDFSRAKGAYRTPPAAPAPSRIHPPPDQSQVQPRVATIYPPASALARVDLSPHKKIVTTAENVIIVATDMTGSMAGWQKEIYKFLPLLFQEGQTLLGQSLQIIFIGFGDAKCRDRFEVTPPGAGPELDGFLTAMHLDASGGGNEIESSDLVLYYVHEQIDTASAKHVYCFTTTDEAAPAVLNETEVFDTLRLTLNREYSNLSVVVRSLLRRMEVFTILRKTDAPEYNPERIKNFWTGLLGQERVIPLERSNLVVEVILGAMAVKTNQVAKFTQSLQARRGQTQFGAQNIATIGDALQKSVMLSQVAGASAVVAPKAGTQALKLDD